MLGLVSSTLHAPKSISPFWRSRSDWKLISNWNLREAISPNPRPKPCKAVDLQMFVEFLIILRTCAECKSCGLFSCRLYDHKNGHLILQQEEVASNCLTIEMCVLRDFFCKETGLGKLDALSKPSCDVYCHGMSVIHDDRKYWTRTCWVNWRRNRIWYQHNCSMQDHPWGSEMLDHLLWLPYYTTSMITTWSPVLHPLL